MTPNADTGGRYVKINRSALRALARTVDACIANVGWVPEDGKGNSLRDVRDALDRWGLALKRQPGGRVVTSGNPSRPDFPPGCEPAAPVEPPPPPATAPGAPDPWYDHETEWFDQLSPPWWGHLYRAWQTIDRWISRNLPTSREWQ